MGSFSNFVGHRIKKYRKSRGYTIEQFSAMINKSKATLSKYENGAITIDIETLYEISQALDIDLKYFVDYQPPTFRSEPALHKNAYFNQSLAYMYYYDGRIRQMVRSLLRFSPAPNGTAVEVTLYLGVASFDDPDRCQHLFTGEMKSYDTITHMVLNAGGERASAQQHQAGQGRLSPAALLQHDGHQPSRQPVFAVKLQKISARQCLAGIFMPFSRSPAAAAG